MALEFKNPWKKGGRLSEDWLSSFKSNFGLGVDSNENFIGTKLANALPIIYLKFPSWSAVLNEDQEAGLASLNSLLTSADSVSITSKTVLSQSIDYDTLEGKEDLLRRVNLAQNRADNVKDKFTVGQISQVPSRGWTTGLTTANISKKMVVESSQIILDSVSRVELQIFYNGTSNTILGRISRVITNNRW